MASYWLKILYIFCLFSVYLRKNLMGKNRRFYVSACSCVYCKVIITGGSKKLAGKVRAFCCSSRWMFNFFFFWFLKMLLISSVLGIYWLLSEHFKHLNLDYLCCWHLFYHITMKFVENFMLSIYCWSFKHACFFFFFKKICSTISSELGGAPFG